MVLCQNNTWNRQNKKITSDLYLPMAEPRRWRQAGAVGCLDRWLGQGRGARTPLGPWSGLWGGPWRAHGVGAVLVIGTTKSTALVATSQRSCSRSISRSATPNHVWRVACSICMPLSAVIYSVLYWLGLILWGKSAYFHKLSMKTTPQNWWQKLTIWN
jgi:hypothetical protein